MNKINRFFKAATLVSILFTMITPTVLCQGRAANKKTPHAYNGTVATIAVDITKNASSDSIKALNLYRWIAGNISYDVAALEGRENPYQKISPATEDLSDEQHEQWYNQQVATMVLKRRKGICDGYARLFQAMCDIVGLESKVINGYGRNGDTIGQPFSVNHSWNAVKFNGQWHLLDACWGSGNVTTAGHFIREFKAYYFAMPPEEFILDHYPEDTKWSLLNEAPKLSTFFSQPYFNHYFQKAAIKVTAPQQGLLEARTGSTILFRLVGRDSCVVPDIAEEGESWFTTLYAPDAWIAKPMPYKNPVISKKQREAVDAIFSYINSLSALIDTSSAQESQTKPIDSSEIHESHFLNPTIKGNVFEYRYQVRAGATFVRFYLDKKPIITYAIRVIK